MYYWKPALLCGVGFIAAISQQQTEPKPPQLIHTLNTTHNMNISTADNKVVIQDGNQSFSYEKTAIKLHWIGETIAITSSTGGILHECKVFEITGINYTSYASLKTQLETIFGAANTIILLPLGSAIATDRNAFSILGSTTLTGIAFNIVAANPNRKGLFIRNNTNKSILIGIGFTPTASHYLHSLPAATGFDFSPQFVALEVKGFWSGGAAASGQLSILETF